MKYLTGKIISSKMQKTVVVEVERMVKHKLYSKIIRKTKKYQVDSNNLDLKEGDTVKIAPTRPISKYKHFKVVSKL